MQSTVLFIKLTRLLSQLLVKHYIPSALRQLDSRLILGLVSNLSPSVPISGQTEKRPLGACFFC
jgi:hypothetical protein